MLPSPLAFALLALVPHALAGSAHVVNNCGTQIYYASVKNNNNARMVPLAAGARYTEHFAVVHNGVSIKVSSSPTGKVTQFEFTLTSAGQLFYDTSNIDGNPFAWNGVSLVPSQQASNAYPSCVIVDCPPGQTCAAAYNRPDDVRTKVCPGSVDLVFTLCTRSKLSGGGEGAAPAGWLNPPLSGTASAAPAVGTLYSSFSAAITTVAAPQGKTQSGRRPRRI